MYFLRTFSSYLLHLSCLLSFFSLYPSLLYAIPPCGSDLYEPNNQRHQAKHISKLHHNRSVHGILCEHDVDWFSVWLNRGQRVEFHLESTDLNDIESFSVFAPRKRTPIGLKTQHSLYQSLHFQVKESGRYRLKLKGKAISFAHYTLSLVNLNPHYPHTPLP